MEEWEIIKWKYPNWNEADFIENTENYRQTRPIVDPFFNKEKNINGTVFYEIRLNGLICARLSPIEYWNLRADMAISEANKLEDFQLRISKLHKAETDIKIHVLYDIEYSGEIYREDFDISKALEKIVARINNIDAANQLRKATQKSRITHRVNALVHNYKIKAGLASELGREEKRLDGGKNREIAFDTLNPASKKVYKPPKESELKKAIELLSEFPLAQKAAINDLDNLQKS